MKLFRLKGCAKCLGDLVLDEGDWLCLQCGTYYYTGLYRNHKPTRWPHQPEAPPRTEKALRPDRPAPGFVAEQEVPPPPALLSVLPQAAPLHASLEVHFAPIGATVLDR